MITLTEEQFKEMIEAAHRAGQYNQGHCDPSAYEAMVYYEREVKKLIIPIVGGSYVVFEDGYEEGIEGMIQLSNKFETLEEAKKYADS